MDAPLVWLIVGILLVVTELVTGTFYLLLLGVAAFAAAGGAQFGASFILQVLIAGAIAIAGVLWIRASRKSRVTPDMQPLDIGQSVTFESWVSRDDRVARVRYRDALWDAVLEGESRGEPGEVLHIVGIDGSTLRVAKRRAA